MAPPAAGLCFQVGKVYIWGFRIEQMFDMGSCIDIYLYIYTWIYQCIYLYYVRDIYEVLTELRYEYQNITVRNHHDERIYIYVFNRYQSYIHIYICTHIDVYSYMHVDSSTETCMLHECFYLPQDSYKCTNEQDYRAAQILCVCMYIYICVRLSVGLLLCIYSQCIFVYLLFYICI